MWEDAYRGLLAGSGFGRTAGDFAQQGQQQQAGQLQQIAGQLQLAGAVQEAQTQQAFQRDAAEYTADPTPERLAQLAVRYPKQAEAISKAWSIKKDAQKQADQTFFGSIYAGGKAGKKDLVLSQLKARRDAEARAGGDVAELDSVIADLTADEPGALKTLQGYALAHIFAADPAGFADAFGLKRDKTHVITNGGALVDDDGKELYRADEPVKYEKVKNADGTETLVEVGGGNRGASGSAPLSVRLNNPGAIRFDPRNQWLGQKGNSGGFVEFDTPENGARAHRLLIANQIKAGFDTPLSWAKHYAPASDGNDPAAYAATIAKGLGIGVNDKIPLGAVGKVAALSARVEAGGTPAPASQSGARVLFTSKKGEGGLDADTVDTMADQYLAGDKTVLQNLGRGTQGSADIRKVRVAIARKAAERGMSGADIAAQMSDFAGALAASRAAGTRTANIELAASEAQKVIPLARKASAAFPRSAFVPFAKAEIAYAKGTNDPNIRRFVAANNALVNVYSRAISPSGVGTVSDKEHARELLNTAFDVASYNAVLDQMEAEIKAAREAPREVRAEIRAGISSGAPKVGSTLPGGFTIVGVRRKNG